MNEKKKYSRVDGESRSMNRERNVMKQMAVSEIQNFILMVN